MTRRGRSQLGVVTIYWRDIPAQIAATTESGTERVLLDDRFQVAIDRAAVVAGLTDAEDYVEHWRRQTTPASGDAGEAAAARAANLDADFDDERLEKMIRNGGVDPIPDTDESNRKADIQ